MGFLSKLRQILFLENSSKPPVRTSSKNLGNRARNASIRVCPGSLSFPLITHTRICNHYFLKFFYDNYFASTNFKLYFYNIKH